MTSPCPECGSYNQKDNFLGREVLDDKTVDIYEIECKECGEIWDDELYVRT